MSSLFCKIFVSKVDSDAVLKELLAKALGHEFTLMGESNHFDDVSIRKNDDYDNNKEKIFPDGFLFFPFLLEIEFSKDVSLGSQVEKVNSILKMLWTSEIAAVAACDFENLLLENGGYKSVDVPFPI